MSYIENDYYKGKINKPDFISDKEKIKVIDEYKQQEIPPNDLHVYNPIVNTIKAGLDKQIMIRNEERKVALEEKAREKHQMDILSKLRQEQDHELEAQKKAEKYYYKNMLDQQPKETYNSFDERKDKAALVMETGKSIFQSNPILGNCKNYRGDMYPRHGSILKGAAMNALNNK